MAVTSRPPMAEQSAALARTLVAAERGAKRFAFGANWQRFLADVDAGRIDAAMVWLRDMLGVADLEGRTLLDIGCGSGLFSLAARRLGAVVHGFDYDADAVVCAEALRGRFAAGDPQWAIERGSILDRDYVERLGTFDIVMAWGVLHHTGDMWTALDRTMTLVKPGGLLFIAIYNDQGRASRFWRVVKRAYCANAAGRLAVTAVGAPFYATMAVGARLSGRSRRPSGASQSRGMSPYRDWIDWLGGYPYEVARPEQLFRVCREAGFELVNLTTTNRLGCNQLVFRKPRA